jgi:hypothetical protein
MHTHPDGINWVHQPHRPCDLPATAWLDGLAVDQRRNIQSSIDAAMGRQADEIRDGGMAPDTQSYSHRHSDGLIHAHRVGSWCSGAGDPVKHPSHYTSHPSGLECWDITRHMNFNLGNAFKYIWRADLKGKPIEDLEKAVEYLQDEIAMRKKAADDE